NLSFIILNGCGDINSSVVSITVTPTSDTIGINQSIVFAAIAKDINGFIVQATPTWTVSGGIGTISSDGLFIAGASSGEGTVTASIEGISGHSTVTVTTNGWLQGKVSDATFGNIQNFRVYLQENTALYSLSDSTGHYSIANIPPGAYTTKTDATILYLGTTNEVTIGSGETKTLDIVLTFQPNAPTVPTTTIPSF
ncbi:MAG: carboxypeptidase-like regulatory domain-containing protein, partial [Candidatus Margulisiibacteriota bacterium]